MPVSPSPSLGDAAQADIILPLVRPSLPPLGFGLDITEPGHLEVSFFRPGEVPHALPPESEICRCVKYPDGSVIVAEWTAGFPVLEGQVDSRAGLQTGPRAG